MELNFEDFKKLALNPELSKWEKIGFPKSYRKEIEKDIFLDISSKIGLGRESVKNILDIGCGCSDLVNHFIDFAVKNNREITLVDSEEMISCILSDQLNHNNVELKPGYFPKVQLPRESFDAIIVYSVLQYVFLEQNLYAFIHECLDLLKPNGKLLLGDIPNFQSRERFLKSDSSEEFRKNAPVINEHIKLDHVNYERMDDAVIFSILQRFRNFGYETYLLPQNEKLPFANRREDILIWKR